MSSTTTTQRTRRVLTLAAAAALLGLSACGGSPEEPATQDPAPAQEQEGGTGEDTDDRDDSDDSDDSDSSDDSAATDDSDADDADDDADGDDGDVDDQAGGQVPVEERPFVALTADVASGEGSGAPWAADDLAAALAAEIGGEDAEGAATCKNDLSLSPGSRVVCSAYPNTPDGEANTEQVPWTAYTVSVPVDGGPGAGRGVLFVRGGGFPADAADDLDMDDVMFTGNRTGSMALAEDISAKDLGQRTLDALTSDTALIDARQTADWKKVTCEDGLSAKGYEVADCTASTRDGREVDLKVAPGTWVGYDHGLLIGISVEDVVE